MAVGNCPKCGTIVDYALFETIEVREHPRGKAWIAVSYLCPRCRAVLGIQIDPVALSDDLVKKIRKD